jgi:hypothetical protein
MWTRMSVRTTDCFYRSRAYGSLFRGRVWKIQIGEGKMSSRQPGGRRRYEVLVLG